MDKKSIKDITQAQEQVKQVAKAVDNLGYAALVVCLTAFLAPLLKNVGDNAVDPSPDAALALALGISGYILAQIAAVALLGKVDEMNIEKERLKEES